MAMTVVMAMIVLVIMRMRVIMPAAAGIIDGSLQGLAWQRHQALGLGLGIS